MEEFETQNCWEPNTPVKSVSSNPICKDSSDSTNFGGSQNWQGALLENPLPDATSTRLGDLNPMSNTSSSIFSSEFKGTRFEANFQTPLVDNNFIAVGQNMWINSHYVPSTPNGDSTPSGNSFDLNLPCKERIDAAPSGNSSSLFSPITPDQSKRTENSQTCSNQTTENQLENAAASREVVENHNPDIDQQMTPQKKPRRKKHRPKVVREGQAKRVRKLATPNPEKNDTSTGKRKYVKKSEISKTESLPELAAHDAENKETRKVKRKYVRKDGTDKSEKLPDVAPHDAENKETPKVKRKYVRKDGTDKSEKLPDVAPQDAENKETPKVERKYIRKNETSKTKSHSEVSPQDAENSEHPKVKRKYVRKNETSKTESHSEVSPQDAENNETPKVKRKNVRKNETSKTESLPEVSPQDAENNVTPKVKRKYIRKSANKTQELSTGELLRKFADTKKETDHCRKSCKKRLNFDENNSIIEESSSSIPESIEIVEMESQNFHIGVEPELPAQLGKGLESMDGNAKTDQIQEVGVQEKEFKKGKCRIIFSDKTHDKEEPFLEMLMNYNNKPTPSLKGSNFSNMTCIGKEEEASAFKKGYDKEEPIVDMLMHNNITKRAPSLNNSNFSNVACIGEEEDANVLKTGGDKEEPIVEILVNNTTERAPSLNNSNFSNFTCIGAGEEANGLKRANDKVEPIVEMLINNNTKSAPSIKDSIFSSMSSIGLGEETSRSKRGSEYIINGEDLCTNVIGCHFNSLSKYKELFPAHVNDGNGISDMHVSTVSKTKKPKRRQIKNTSKASVSKSSRDAAEQNANNFTPHNFNNADMTSYVPETSYLHPASHLYPSTYQTQSLSFNAQPQQNEFEHQLLLEQETMMTGMGCNIPPQVCSFSSLIETLESNQLPYYMAGGASPVGNSQINQGAHSSHACIEIKVSEKRKTGNNRKKNRGVARKKNPTVDDITEYLKHLNIDPKRKEKNALVLYNGVGAVVPFEGPFNPIKKNRRRAKVDLDAETDRVWRLLLENINSEGIDGTDEDKEKWWETERRVFQGRADSFIARMHLVQGDRRFTPWKGSVVDSVVGVYLTQNVSDHASSSAFMSLAAHFPIKTGGNFEKCSKETKKTVKEQKEQIPEQKDTICLSDPFGSHTSFMELLQMAESQTGVQEEKSGYMSSYTETVRHFIYQSEGSTQNLDHGLYNQNTCKRPIAHPVEEVPSSERLREESPSSLTPNGSEENCASEQSEITVESTTQDTVRKVMNESFKTGQTSPDAIKCNSSHGQATNLCQECVDTVNSCINNYTQNTKQKQTESSMTEPQSAPSTSVATSELKKGSAGKKKQTTVDWDKLRLKAEENGKRERTADTMDSLDWEAVRRADVHEVAATIKERGMNNVLAGRIQDFLDRIVAEHGSIDLEWLRDVPPDKAKEYLLSIRGLGLKSVECVRLLTLHHLAFPVDVNVGRIAVRLGWVPLQTLPESLQLHLLELYPVMEHIQQYLWPRLCKLDQRTLYELHYQMITFGKVFCTKSKPNCNACPMRGDCRHFASAFASARLALPGPEDKSMVSATANKEAKQTPIVSIEQLQLPEPQPSLEQLAQSQAHMFQPTVELPATSIVEEPIIEVPNTPEPEVQFPESDIEDAFPEDPEEIPTIRLNLEKFTQNLQSYMENKMELQEGDVSKALVAITQEAASIPMPKLKNVNQLRTEHQVYELPDSHPLLEGLDKREPDDPCSYLLAIWTPGETADSIDKPESRCSFQDSGNLCEVKTCFSCNSIRETNSQTVRGTLLIPCRTAMRGSFPLNGTYFQVNEVFADHASSINPIDVPRSWIWNLPRRIVYFGTSIPTIFKGLSTESIQYCFWRGFVCVRGFDQKKRAPRPLMARLHFPASKLPKASGKNDKKKG